MTRKIPEMRSCEGIGASLALRPGSKNNAGILRGDWYSIGDTALLCG